MKSVEYNVPIEVPNQTIYNSLMKDLEDIIAGRKDGNKYYIKLMLIHYKGTLESELNNYDFFNE